MRAIEDIFKDLVELSRQETNVQGNEIRIMRLSLEISEAVTSGVEIPDGLFDTLEQDGRRFALLGLAVLLAQSVNQ